MSFKKSLSLCLLALFVISCAPRYDLSSDTNGTVSTLSSKKDTFAPLGKPDVISMPSPNKNVRPDGATINTIVLHHTASIADAKGIGTFFANPTSKVSSHYVVDKTGYIVQPVDDSERAWHAGKSEFNGVGDVNNFSIGIEICNVGDNVDPYPDAQYDALIRLVGYLSKTYNIPLKNITRHRDIALPAGRKNDTSDNFSVQRVLNGVSDVLRGVYSPEPFEKTKAVNYGDFREIMTRQNQATLKDLADLYLDSELRWEELKVLNPSFNEKSTIPLGTKIKIPLSLKYFFQLSNKSNQEKLDTNSSN